MSHDVTESKIKKLSLILEEQEVTSVSHMLKIEGALVDSLTFSLLFKYSPYPSLYERQPSPQRLTQFPSSVFLHFNYSK